MGNCWGAPVDNHSHSATKPSSPNTSGHSSKQNGSTEERNNSKNAESIVSETPPSTGKIITPNLKIFTVDELKSTTRNFGPDEVLGEGGFGKVFKGWVDQKTYAPLKDGLGIAVVVKRSNPESFQGLKEWQSEVKFLGKFCHPNLIKLLGYCSKDKECLLVYEYMPKGSLDNYLFGNGAEPLPWGIRLKIAIGAARGLAFLHTSDNPVIHRNFKSSNILLDEAYNAKLSNFGLAMLGPEDGKSHVSTEVMGTYGYAAPEYIATGQLYVKSDVYSFGIVLLEMLMGQRAIDTNRPNLKRNLVDWAKPSLSHKKKIKRLMDPRLQDQYPLNGACQAAQLVLKCVGYDPRNRPSMEEVFQNLEQINAIK